jgi:hypothetical protein
LSQLKRLYNVISRRQGAECRNIQSIVRFNDAEGKIVGLGTIVSQRCVVTMGFVIQYALGLPHNDASMPTGPVSFQMPFSSGKAMISSRVISWEPIGEKFHIAVLAVSSESENFLSPAPLITARDTNFFFDRRFRMLANSPGVADLYVSGTLEGALPNGLVQLQLNVDSARTEGAGGSPIWDIETGSALGIYCSRLVGNSIGFMAPTQTIAAAWPELQPGSVVLEKVGAGRTKAPKIFICHASEDAVVATEMYDRLKEAGYDPWLDKRSLMAGQNWDYEIKKAVKGSEFFVVLLSQNSVGKKGYIQREFKLAMESLEEVPEGQIYLIPVRIDDCLVPSQFAAFQWVDLQSTEGHDQVQKAIQFQLSSSARQALTPNKPVD